MTKTQVLKAMEASGIAGEVRGTRSQWEVELASDSAMRKFRRLVAKLGGYKTGYGAWILQARYETAGDWNDRSSRWHY